MIYGYTEVRTLTESSLRELFTVEKWYMEGTFREFRNLLDVAKKENITTDDIVELATDIIEHSPEAVTNYLNNNCKRMSEVYTHVMQLIANKCIVEFKSC